jgi:proteasome accessory factor C
MLPWLQSRGPVHISEVARVFNISIKEVLADLALLTFVGPEQAGGGLVDIQYEDEIVKVVDPQGLKSALSLNMFERISLLMGLRILQDLELANPATFSALEKLESVEESELNISKLNQTINDCLSQKRLLSIQYLSFGASKATTREVEPHQIVVKSSTLYLKAWCRSSNGWREFRIDRILDATALNEFFDERQSEKSLNELGWAIEIDLTTNALWVLEQYAVQATQTNANNLKITMSVYSAVWLFQFLVSTVTSIQSVQMEEALKQEVLAELESAISRLKKV